MLKDLYGLFKYKSWAFLQTINPLVVDNDYAALRFMEILYRDIDLKIE